MSSRRHNLPSVFTEERKHYCLQDPRSVWKNQITSEDLFYHLKLQVKSFARDWHHKLSHDAKIIVHNRLCFTSYGLSRLTDTECKFYQY